MSILKLQSMEPVAVESAVAVLSSTSSHTSCCVSSNKPGL